MIFIRLILTVALIYGVYTETGVYTTIFAVLVAIYVEARIDHRANYGE